MFTILHFDFTPHDFFYESPLFLSGFWLSRFSYLTPSLWLHHMLNYIDSVAISVHQLDLAR